MISTLITLLDFAINVGKITLNNVAFENLKIDNNIGEVNLKAKKLASLTPISNDLLRYNAVGIDGWVADDLMRNANSGSMDQATGRMRTTASANGAPSSAANSAFSGDVPASSLGAPSGSHGSASFSHYHQYRTW